MSGVRSTPLYRLYKTFWNFCDIGGFGKMGLTRFCVTEDVTFVRINVERERNRFLFLFVLFLVDCRCADRLLGHPPKKVNKPHRYHRVFETFIVAPVPMHTQHR